MSAYEQILIARSMDIIKKLYPRKSVFLDTTTSNLYDEFTQEYSNPKHYYRISVPDLDFEIQGLTPDELYNKTSLHYMSEGIDVTNEDDEKFKQVIKNSYIN